MTNPFLAFHERYERDAKLFVMEVLGMDGRDEWHTLDAEQADILDAVSRGERGISLRSGNGVGKTTTLAWAIVWQNVCVFPQKTVCTAPSGGQLFDALAAETVTWLKRLPKALLDIYEIQSEGFHHKAAPEESFTSFRTSRAETPEALAGIHCEAGRVLLIGDEASGIPDPVFQSASGSMSGRNATTILAGNPTRLTGLFYDSHTKLRDRWFTVHMSCIGHPRVSPEFVEDYRRRYGEQSNAYRIHVLGEFPLADNDAVIPRELMELARVRDIKPIGFLPIWGVDVEGGGKDSDASALVKRRANVVAEPPLVWHDLEEMQLVGRIKQEWDQTIPSDRPSEICVDAIGYGAGVAQRLAELGLPARAINVAESPAMRDQYQNLKTELWFMAREWFSARDCKIPAAPKSSREPDLGEDLCAVNYLPPMSSGKMRIEPKSETKKRLGHSPDLADAFVLTFAGNAITAQQGGLSVSWNTPLKRDICHV